jgi:type I restriction enzyme S subunit
VQYDFPLSAAQAAALGKPKLAGQPYRTSGGKMLYHPELKREIPKEWEVHNLGDILSISRGASPRPIDEFLSDSGIPWIKISDATASDNRFILETKQFILKKGGPMAKIVPPDTLILTNSATPAVPRITKIHSGVHDGWLVINDYTSGLSKDFMFHYFCHERPRIICLGNGSIFKNLKTDYIKGLKIALPPNGIWSEATDHFKLISDQIYNATQQNQELTALRDWLLPMLMNGQVRVG